LESGVKQGSQPLLALALLGACAVLFPSCSSVFSDLPAAAGGLPQDAPARTANAPAYPAVHDMPPPRPNSVLTEDQKKQLEAELAAMRAEQAKRAAASTKAE
jgi:hypothetical protein